MQNRYNRSYFINSSSFLSPPIPIQIRNFKPIISLFKAFSSLQWSLQEWQEIHQILSSFNSKSILFFTIHFRSTIATNLSRFRVFSQASVFDTFTLKCWYGGNFKTNGVGLQYLGGEFKTLVVDPDIISWFDLEELVDTSVGIKYPHTLYYLLPNCLTFEEGLRNINSDACVLEMASIGAKERAIDVYIVREEDDESLFVCINKKLKLSIGGNIDGERRKLTPRHIAIL